MNLMTFYPRDRALYISFAWYVAANVALLGMSYGTVYGHIALGAIVPGIALLGLIGFQVSARLRFSFFAFWLVFAGLVAVAFMTAALSYAAAGADHARYQEALPPHIVRIRGFVT